MASSGSRFATCPPPPYYRSERGQSAGYALRPGMIEDRARMPGYLGVETARGPTASASRSVLSMTGLESEAGRRKAEHQCGPGAGQPSGI